MPNLQTRRLMDACTPAANRVIRLNRLRVIYAWTNSQLTDAMLKGKSGNRFMQLMNRLNRVQLAIIETEKSF